jgi:hypothetical protein
MIGSLFGTQQCGAVHEAGTMGQHFRAPWSTKLKLTTGGLVAILLVAVVTIQDWGSLLILGILVIGATFAIRGYSIVDGRLLILRLGWATKLDLADLTGAEASPGATLGSVRTMGIGGLFGFVGYYHNAVLGSYKAYSTNEMNAVVLKFGEETIVVTPERPFEFVDAIKQSMEGELRDI